MRLRLLLPAFLLAAPLSAQSGRMSGFSLAAHFGIGGSSFSYSPAPPYEHSPQTLIRLEATRVIGRFLALTIQGTQAKDFGAGDCIGLDPVCAPPLTYRALSAAVGFLPQRTTTAGGPILSLGAGLFRLPESSGNWGNGPVPAATVVGLQGSAEIALAKSRSAPAVGIQGVLLPHATGRAVYFIHVFAGWRLWFAPASRLRAAAAPAARRRESPARGRASTGF